MKVEFEEDYLKELYVTGRSSKKHKKIFQPEIIKGYIKKVNIIKSISKIEDLKCIRSLNCEILKGSLAGLFSVRVNDKYRIIFKIRNEGKPPNHITICSINDLSNHYDD